MIAERGREIILRTDCSGCHTPQGEEGPNVNEFLAGGIKLSSTIEGSIVSRNLTSDPQTGLARRTDAEVMRVLRSGMLPEGRHTNYRAMPWSAFSNWTEEDRYAVVTYLRHLKPVYHEIPDVEPPKAFADPTAFEAFWAYDYAKHVK
jgi:mono/diheme cytochrome c family protein